MALKDSKSWKHLLMVLRTWEYLPSFQSLSKFIFMGYTLNDFFGIIHTILPLRVSQHFFLTKKNEQRYLKQILCNFYGIEFTKHFFLVGFITPLPLVYPLGGMVVFQHQK